MAIPLAAAGRGVGPQGWEGAGARTGYAAASSTTCWLATRFRWTRYPPQPRIRLRPRFHPEPMGPWLVAASRRGHDKQSWEADLIGRREPVTSIAKVWVNESAVLWPGNGEEGLGTRGGSRVANGTPAPPESREVAGGERRGKREARRQPGGELLLSHVSLGTPVACSTKRSSQRRTGGEGLVAVAYVSIGPALLHNVARCCTIWQGAARCGKVL